MTKHYIAEKEKVLLVDKKYDGSTWSDYSSSDAGKVPRIAETTTGSGVYTLQLLAPSAGSVAWGDVTSKPFDQVGAGLTVVDVTEAGGTVKKLTADTQLHFEILDISTKTPGPTYKNTIALVARTGTSEDKNVYTEYACVRTSAEGVTPEVWAWEKLGDLTASITQANDKITINGTELQFASYDGTTTPATAKCGIISGSDYKAFTDKQSAIAHSETTDVPQAIVTTNNDGIVDKRDIATAVTASMTSSTTDLATAGAVIGYSAKLDQTAGASTVNFALGCDATGPYIEY